MQHTLLDGAVWYTAAADASAATRYSQNRTQNEQQCCCLRRAQSDWAIIARVSREQPFVGSLHARQLYSHEAGIEARIYKVKCPALMCLSQKHYYKDLSLQDNSSYIILSSQYTR